MDMSARRTLPTAVLLPATIRAMISTAKILLGGVGQIPSAVEQMTVAIHYRRSLTDAEYSKLPWEWRAIPAVHQAGHMGVVMERDT